MLGLGLLLAGCAGGSGDARPVMAMDGQHYDMQDPVENGRALILTGQLGLAVDTLSQVASRDPLNARALTLLAVAYGQLKRFDLADRYHAEALRVDPGSVAALNNWGYSYLVRGDRIRAADLLERAVATRDVRPIVAANLTLARSDGQAAALPATLAAPAVGVTHSVQLSQHVTLVRRVGRLVRVAPGVQVLLTIGQDAEQVPTQISQNTVEPPAAASVASDDPAAGMTDTRFALFRALFALTEGEGVAPAWGVPMVDQLADASFPAPASPFGYFPDVDDFTRQ
jgi:tetratricopeptide (TPR) repeat protein